MLRFRKLWMVVAGIILVLVLITSFFKPDLVTVVPNQKQLNQEKPDLHLQKEEKESKTSNQNISDSVNTNQKEL